MMSHYPKLKKYICSRNKKKYYFYDPNQWGKYLDGLFI